MANLTVSRLWAFCAVLCMAAMLNAGFASVRVTALNIQHQASGDIELADGGWVSACAGGSDDCAGHLDDGPAHSDTIPLHHHHHSAETDSGPLPPVSRIPVATARAGLALRPGAATALSGRSLTTPDQPPRVLSRV